MKLKIHTIAWFLTGIIILHSCLAASVKKSEERTEEKVKGFVLAKTEKQSEENTPKFDIKPVVVQDDGNLAVLSTTDLSGKLGKFPETWEVPPDAVYLSYDEREGSVILRMTNNEPTWITKDCLVYSTVNLPSGHYVFRALARANSMHAKMSASYSRYVGGARFLIQIGLSPEFRTVELPFFVDDTADEHKVSLAFESMVTASPFHTITIEVKDISLLRLGDLSPFHWISTGDIHIDHHPFHQLEKLREASVIAAKQDKRKAGKTIFHDTFTGAELWLLSRGGNARMGAGHSHISPDGKYLYIYGNRSMDMGYVIRMDGSEIYPLMSLNLPWLFPWMQRRLPALSDAADWVVENRTMEGVSLINLSTGEKMELRYPNLSGWELYILNRWLSPLPSAFSRGGVDIDSVDHETVAWISEDRRRIALSDIDGSHFREFEIKTISPAPEKDIFYPELSYSHGKGEDTWINVMDKDENRYYMFELNREVEPERPFRRCARSGIKNEPENERDPDTPYQAWALPLDKNDNRGLLRVVPNPNPGIEIRDTLFGDKILGFEYFLWWYFSVGLGSVVGERCPLILEDGTLLHSPGRQDHGVFRNTIATRHLYVGEDGMVRGDIDYMGSYLRTDYVVWPHPFRHDDKYALVTASITPSLPMAVIDLKNRALWTLAVTNARIERQHLPAGTSWVGERFNMSSDFTKVAYISSMLCYDVVPGRGGDAYIAVMRYPEPPTGLELKGNRLVWYKPQQGREIGGFNIYRSMESGRGYTKINTAPVEGFSFELPPDGINGYYVATSVERSGLESRIFSNEAAVGQDGPLRHYYEPENGTLSEPMVPVFLPSEASNGYAVAITDPDLLYRERLQKGMEGGIEIKVDVPAAGIYKIEARVKALKEGMKGLFRVSTNGKYAGEITVESTDWTWVAMEKEILELDKGNAEIVITTSNTGIAFDKMLFTNDLGFKPQGKGDTYFNPPSQPGKAEVKNSNGGVNLKWEPSFAPQGVRYYSVHRSGNSDFEPQQANMVGSTAEPFFTDYYLETGSGDYYYRVVAVDNWNNRSAPSESSGISIGDSTNTALGTKTLKFNR